MMAHIKLWDSIEWQKFGNSLPPVSRTTEPSGRENSFLADLWWKGPTHLFPDSRTGPWGSPEPWPAQRAS